MRFKLVISSLLMICFVNSYGQEWYKGLPKDLDKVTIIFPLYDSLKVYPDEKIKERLIENANRANTILTESNIILKEAVKDYPFKYALIHYKDIADSLKTGKYKYYIDISLFARLKYAKTTSEGLEAFYQRGAGGEVAYSTIDFLDGQNGDHYRLDEIRSNVCFAYHLYMPTLIKKVKKQYKIP